MTSTSKTVVHKPAHKKTPHASPVPQPTTGGSPSEFRLRAYQVGFGDCFLLSFKYPDVSRHVLIDFGTVKLPPDATGDYMLRIAQDIKAQCGSDGLTAVVETHRHRDHISGFTSQNDQDSGGIIRNLKPQLVMQPWTEDPNAAVDAQGPTASATAQAFVASLQDMHAFSARAALEAQRFQQRDVPGAQELGFIGDNNLTNESAVKNLMSMGNAHEYLFCGATTQLGNLLPGVKVHVLGPPTLKQSSAIKNESTTNASEFWQLAATTARNVDAQPCFDASTEWKGDYPPSLRWFIEHADSVRSDQSLGLVRILDKAMNNTSIILLFEIAGKRFLFPGDAELENWQYALSLDACKALLSGVDFYKVGHHGSRNATPKSMWAQLKGGKHDDLQTVVSTLSHVYGQEDKHTEVPRSSLLQELRQNSTFYSTEGQHDLAHEITFTFS